MITFVIPILAGIILAIVYTSLLTVPAVGRLLFLGIIVRIAIIALAIYSMLHYSINHLILMLGVFYVIVITLIVAYKGVR